jgi:glycosyltransferase involved in cell wall biosynthesis
MTNMRRILLLCDTNADFQTQRLAEGIARDVKDEFELTRATVGRGGDFPGVATGILQLRSLPKFDVVHSCGGAALTLAALASSARIIYSPTQFPSRRTIGWLRAVMAHCTLEIVASTVTMARRCMSGGIAPDHVHVIRPGVEFGRIKRRKNPELRAALGMGIDDFVVLAVGESTRAAAHDRAVWATGILNVLDPRYKLLMWGRGKEMPRLKRFAVNLAQTEMVRFAEERLGQSVEFEELLGAADLALLTAAGPVPTLPIAITMAAGLPIVATVTYTASELLEDRHTALMVAKATPKLLARRILDVREDAGLQWSIADMARTEAFEYFAMTRFVRQWSSVYRQICEGAKVQVPQDSPGAGLRFHGRA